MRKQASKKPATNDLIFIRYASNPPFEEGFAGYAWPDPQRIDARRHPRASDFSLWQEEIILADHAKKRRFHYRPSRFWIQLTGNIA